MRGRLDIVVTILLVNGESLRDTLRERLAGMDELRGNSMLYIFLHIAH